MATVFIYSNSYIARTFVYNIQYLIKFQVNKIFLLKENHSENEKWNISNCDVELCNTLNECIIGADYVFIVNDGSLPSKIINKLYILCEEYRKHCISIKYIKPSINFLFDDLLACNKNTPLIAHVHVGEFSQGFSGEVLLNKILTNRKVKYLQLFTRETFSLLSELKDNNILNEKIVTEIKNKDFDVIVCSLHISSDIELYMESIRLLSKLNPDFTIVQINNNFPSIDTICNLLKYRTGNTVDMIIKSHYSCLQNGKSQYLFYSETIESVSTNTLDIESNDLEEDIDFGIFSKISLPENILRII